MKRSIALAAVVLLTAAQGDDPLLRPIAADYATRWLAPVPPVKIHGNSYLVGFKGLNMALIRTSRGLILIDAALPQAVAATEANIRALGFDPKDVKLILSTEPHYDHAGALAALARDTGATVVASAAAAAVIESGKVDLADPQAGGLVPFPAVKVRRAADGEAIRLGDTVVTPRATPGHTAGSMSWTWQSCEGGKCVDIVFGSSLRPVSADGYRFSNHPEQVAMFRDSFDKVAAMKCDILISAHPDQSGGPEGERFVRGPEACRTYAATYRKSLDERLAKEAQ